MKQKKRSTELPPSIFGEADQKPAEKESTGELPKVAAESIEGATPAEPAKAEAAPAAPVFGFRKKTMWGF